METTPLPLVDSNTKLTNRTIWYDGDLTVAADRLVEMIQQGIPPSRLYVDSITDDIIRYNKLRKNTISIKTDVRKLDREWKIDDNVMFPSSFNIESFLFDRLFERNKSSPLTEAQYQTRAVRIIKEMRLYEKHKLTDILRVIIYVINTLELNKVVWGVGRGSSVSSYILYLIGVHDVDSVEYELNMSDFIQE